MFTFLRWALILRESSGSLIRLYIGRMINKINHIGMSCLLLAALASEAPAFAIPGVKENSTLTASVVTTAQSGATAVRDAQLKKAVTLLEESRKADQAKSRRKYMKPASTEKIVRHMNSSEHTHILIMGGAEAFPM